MPEQHGFFGPRSTTGAAALLPDPPWRYSGDLLTVEYRVHPDRVRCSSSRITCHRPGQWAKRLVSAFLALAGSV